MRAARQSFRMGLMTYLDGYAVILFWMAQRFIFFLTIFALWKAIFLAQPAGTEIGGYGYAEMISYYVWLNFVVSVAGSAFEWQLLSTIRSGQFASELVKPMSHLTHTIMQNVAWHILQGTTAFVIYTGTAYVLGIDVFAAVLPSQLPWFALSLLLSAGLFCCISSILGSLGFFLVDPSHLFALKFAAIYILGGAIVPLDLFPEAVRSVVYLSPFPWMSYFPVRVLFEGMTTPQLLQGVGMQFLWLAVLVLTAGGIWRSGIRRFESVGG